MAALVARSSTPPQIFDLDSTAFSPENLKANMPVVDLLKGVAEEKNATPAQIALAWLLAQHVLKGLTTAEAVGMH